MVPSSQKKKRRCWNVDREHPRHKNTTERIVSNIAKRYVNTIEHIVNNIAKRYVNANAHITSNTAKKF